jgi:hypothetical protein
MADGICTARRRDGQGSTLADPLPEGLRLRILADYHADPVPRDPAWTASTDAPGCPHSIPDSARTGTPCQPRLQPHRSTRPGIPSMRSPRSSWVPTAVSWRTPSRSSRPGILSLRHGMTCKLSSVTCSPSTTIAPGSRVPDLGRPHDASTLTSPELERIRRQLAASLALTRPGSAAQVPILAHLRAIDTELARRVAPKP